MPLAEQFSFGSFRLEPDNARLLRGQEAIPLKPKAFDVLVYLVRNADRLVTQEELIDAIWPDTIVGDSSLKSCIRQIRQALGDGAKEPQFIETVHRRGYRFIAPLAMVCSASLEAATARRAAVEPPPPALLVGREAELRQLHALWEQAVAGERQIVFVTGGPGRGKTSLVETFEQQISAGGQAWVATGQCFEQFGSGEAYLPVLEGITQLARGPGSDRLLKLLTDHAPTWIAEIPVLRPRLSPEAAAAQLAAATPERMLREMAEALEALTAETPLLLVVEDLHWGDYSTLDLISALARRRHSARLLVLATYRPVEAVLSGHPLRGVKQDLQARGLCHELPVGLLTAADVGRYLDARFPGGGLPEDLSRLLHDRTEGNPFFMANLVDYWQAQGVLAPRADGTQSDRAGWELRADLHFLDDRLPASIRALIEKQLERLSPEDLLILEGASVAGVEFSAAAAAAAAEADPLACEECCERLAREHHFLQPKGEGSWPDGTVSARYRFGHELYHRVVYERIAGPRRRRLHTRLGQRLEAACEGKRDELAAELAIHFEQAKDHLRAASYLALAADRAARYFAHREAIDYLRRGLAAVQEVPPPERIPAELRLQLSLGLQLQITQGFASPDAQRAYARARELCRQSGDPPLLFPVLWGLWLYHKVRSELVTAREMAAELYSLAQQRCDTALELQSHQAFAVTTLCLGQPAATREHMERGAALYDPQKHHALTFLFGQDPGVACTAFGAVALWLLGHPEQALERSREATRLSHEFSQPSTQALALHFAAMVHQCRRDGRSALACADLALAIAANQGLSFWHAGGLVLRGWAQAELGSVGEGLALLREGLDAWDATGSVTYRTYFLALLAEVLARAEEFDQAREKLDEALALVEQTSEGLYQAELHRLRGTVLAADGAKAKQRQVEEEFRRAIDIARQQEAKSLELRAAVSLGQFYKLKDRSAEVCRLIRPIYEQFTEGFDTADLQEAAVLLRTCGKK